MDRNTLDNKNRKLVSQRNIFLFFSFILSLALVLFSCFFFMKNERIIIVPTGGSPLWIEDSKVSDNYLEKFGSYIADLLLTRTPTDVDRKNKILLEHVHPSYYHEIKKQLHQDRQNIVQFDQSLFFRPIRSFIDPIKQAYILEGELCVFIGKIGDPPTCAQSQQKKFTFEFQCRAGKLLLKSLKREELT